MMICRLTGVAMQRQDCVLVREARAVHPRVTMDPSGVSRTQQADKDQTDINNIVGRYTRTGQFPVQRSDGVYADVTALQGELTELQARSAAVIDTFRQFEKGYQAKADQAKPDQAKPDQAKPLEGESKVGPPAS